MHAFWRALVLVVLGVFLRSVGQSADELHVRGHALADRPGYGFLFLLGLPARRAISGSRSAVILVGYWAAFALYPLPGPDFDYAAVGVPADWPHWLTGFAAHWNKNSNLAWAFDTWFLNLLPARRAVRCERRRLRDAELHPDAGDDDPGPDRRRRAAERPVALGQGGLADVAGCRSACWPAAASARLGVCPVVKRIWTPSWVLFSGGWCFLLLAAFYAVIDVLGLRALGLPADRHRHELDRRLLPERAVRADSSRRTSKTHLGRNAFQVFGPPTSRSSRARPCCWSSG